MSKWRDRMCFQGCTFFDSLSDNELIIKGVQSETAVQLFYKITFLKNLFSYETLWIFLDALFRANS